MEVNGATPQVFDGKTYWVKPIEVKYDGISEMGKSTIEIRCPFCGELVTAYIWSYAGGGKKCTKCKALLSGNSARILQSKKGK